MWTVLLRLHRLMALVLEFDNTHFFREEVNDMEYESPQVITYTAEEILEELGPAQAQSNYGSGGE